MADIIWAKWILQKVGSRAKNGTHRGHTHTFNRQMCSHKFKTPKIIAEMQVEKRQVHGVTQWMNQLDGNIVTFHYAVSVIY